MIPTFWMILVTELFLGGNGHLVEFFGIAIRTWILAGFLFSWGIYHICSKTLRQSLHVPNGLALPLSLIALSVIAGIVLGIKTGHEVKPVIQDAIPFFFLLLIFPARQYLVSEYYPFYSKLIQAHLLLTAAFSSITLFLFSSGISIIHGPYYKWFRDVAGGKITDVGNHFFRIVLPEHLLLTPILLFLVWRILREPKRREYWLWFGVGAIPFMLELSRTYMIAYVIGLLVLFSRQYWRRWLLVSLGTGAILLGVFSSAHLLASRGASLGFELLGPRLGSIANPDSERSAATRKTLLPHVWEAIQKHPIIGNGLGATVSFIDPATGEMVRTRQFDWGYLELWAELGIFGLGAMLFLLTLVYRNHQSPLLLSLLAAFGFMNVTAPALFHVFGIVFLVCVISFRPQIYGEKV